MHRKSTGVEKYLFRSKESVALGSVLYVKDGVLYRSWGWGRRKQSSVMNPLLRDAEIV